MSGFVGLLKSAVRLRLKREATVHLATSSETFAFHALPYAQTMSISTVYG